MVRLRFYLDKASSFWCVTAALGLSLVACPAPEVLTLDGEVGDSDGGVAAGPADAGPLPPQVEIDPGFFPDGGIHGPRPRCESKPFGWWGTEDLGQILESEFKHHFSKEALGGFVSGLSDYVQLSRDFTYDAAVHRILYQTQNRGFLTDATALIAYPLQWPEVEPIGVLLYLHGTAGFRDQCSPSSQIDSIFEANYGNAAILAMIASFGYLVVAPDYLGLKSMGVASEFGHPYLIAEPTAIASLDGLRATLRFVEHQALNFQIGSMAIYGVSQGGHAAAFVSRYAPYYAPELEFAGAVYAVPPLDFVAQSQLALESGDAAKAGNTAAFLSSAHDWYQADPSGLDTVLSEPSQIELQELIENQCVLPSLDGELQDIFTPALLDAALEDGFGSLAPWDCYVRENSFVDSSLPSTAPIPALLILAEEDTLVAPEVERNTFDTLCDQGVPLSFLECQGAGHSETFFHSIDNAMDYLESRLAGDPLPDDLCILRAAERCASAP